MSLTLYERLAAHDHRPSPFCWRTRFALAHKGLTPEVVAIRFTEADRVAFSGQAMVPVLVDGDRVVSDSWSIACYLEDAYPQQPSLFGGEGGKALARTLNHWVDATLQTSLAGILAPALYDILEPADQAYYRKTREARWGRTFESMRDERETYLAAAHTVFEPLRLRLAEAPYICGDAPAYGDYLIFGVFQWARCTDPQDMIPAEDDALRTWRDRMLDLYDGLARSVPAFGSAG
ncbi:glutathione S-transferase N-terminal domain-containing protein [Hoeflea sp. TYP-13]|uniref:glutathione S-transferase N-terminal domain-containing protein n=1 Tax=Hoeflea sp. TYP-13 TaxID=3230023 RepID=UPI0034C5E6C4